MPFRSMTADPENLKKLCEAFDAAWIAINSARPVDPLKSSAERERLGYIIAQLWRADPNASLAHQAVRQFMKGAVEAPSLSEIVPKQISDIRGCSKQHY